MTDHSTPESHTPGAAGTAHQAVEQTSLAILDFVAEHGDDIAEALRSGRTGPYYEEAKELVRLRQEWSAATEAFLMAVAEEGEEDA